MVVYNTDVAAAVFPRYRATSRAFDLAAIRPTSTMGAIMDPRDRHEHARAAGAADLAMDHAVVVVQRDDDPEDALECPYGWEGRRVACLDRTAWNVARAVAGGYHVRDRVDLRQVQLSDWYPHRLPDLLRGGGGGGYHLAVVAVAAGTTLASVLGRMDGVRFRGLGDVSMTRIQAFHPFCDKRDIDLSALGLGEGAETTISVRRVMLAPGTVVNADGREGFTTDAVAVYDWEEPSFVTDGRYRCFSPEGDGAEVVGRESYYQCVSRYGSTGDPQRPGIWDARCERDEDCPWSAHGGRCSRETGVCEVPIGVRAVTYRTSWADGRYHAPFRICGEGVRCGRGAYMYPRDVGRWVARFPDRGDP